MKILRSREGRQGREFLIVNVFPRLRDALTRGFLIICTWHLR